MTVSRNRETHTPAGGEGVGKALPWGAQRTRGLGTDGADSCRIVCHVPVTCCLSPCMGPCAVTSLLLLSTGKFIPSPTPTRSTRSAGSVTVTAAAVWGARHRLLSPRAGCGSSGTGGRAAHRAAHSQAQRTGRAGRGLLAPGAPGHKTPRWGRLEAEEMGGLGARGEGRVPVGAAGPDGGSRRHLTSAPPWGRPKAAAAHRVTSSKDSLELPEPLLHPRHTVTDREPQVSGQEGLRCALAISSHVVTQVGNSDPQLLSEEPGVWPSPGAPNV